MATPVPYRGAPELAPSMEPTPSVNIQTPPAAFGVNVAGAIEHLGQVQEGAGKELFDRALAMQQLDQYAAANAGVADFQNKALDSFTTYANTQGKSAVVGYHDFQSNVDQLREDGANAMPSPYARYLYNNESRQAAFYMKRYGAMHAKEEQKRYVIGSAQAAVKSDQDAMELNPADLEGNRQKIEQIKSNLNHLADVGGVSPEQRTMIVNEGVSKAVYGQVIGMARKDPIGAKTLLDQAVADKEIVGSEADRAYAYVRQQNMTIGVRHGASELRSGQDIRFGDQVVSPVVAQTGIKAIESGGNYTAVNTKSGALGAYQVMPNNLPVWLKEAGMESMTPQEFLKNPVAQDKLFNFKFGQYMQQYGSFNRAAAMWFSGNPDAPMSTSDGGHNLAEYLTTANRAMFKGAPLAVQVAMGQQYAQVAWPDDPEFADRMTQQIEILHNNDVRIRNDTVFDSDQAIWGAMYNGVGQGGKIPTTVEELTQDPQIKTAWDWLAQNEPSKLQPILNALTKNSKGDVAMNADREKNWQRLVGESKHDPQAFLEETQDLSKVDLPWNLKNQIIRMQADIDKKKDAIPSVGPALKILQDQIFSVFGSPIQDKENYYLFTGILFDAMSDFQKAQGRAMNADEIKAIGTQLLQQSTSGWGWFKSAQTWFEIPDNDPGFAGWAEKAKALPGGAAYTTPMLKRVYMRLQLEQQFQNLYAKPPKQTESAGQ